MAKISTKDTNMTSYFGVEFVTTPNELTNLFGESTYGNNHGEDKVNMQWICETEDGNVFTIHDYKYYRPLKMNEPIRWHIGGYSKEVTEKALIELTAMLSQKI